MDKLTLVNSYRQVTQVTGNHKKTSLHIHKHTLEFIITGVKDLLFVPEIFAQKKIKLLNLDKGSNSISSTFQYAVNNQSLRV